MIGIYAEITGQEALDDHIDLCNKASEVVNEISSSVVKELEPEILRDFQKEPPPVKWPVEWTSAKQRKFVWRQIKTDQWSSPLSRTHAIAGGWKVLDSFIPGRSYSVELVNEAEGAEYVEGIYQQDWHKATGWLDAVELAGEWSERLSTRISAGIEKEFFGSRKKRKRT